MTAETQQWHTRQVDQARRAFETRRQALVAKEARVRRLESARQLEKDLRQKTGKNLERDLSRSSSLTDPKQRVNAQLDAKRLQLREARDTLLQRQREQEPSLEDKRGSSLATLAMAYAAVTERPTAREHPGSNRSGSDLRLENRAFEDNQAGLTKDIENTLSIADSKERVLAQLNVQWEQVADGREWMHRENPLDSEGIKNLTALMDQIDAAHQAFDKGALSADQARERAGFSELEREALDAHDRIFGQDPAADLALRQLDQEIGNVDQAQYAYNNQLQSADQAREQAGFTELQRFDLSENDRRHEAANEAAAARGDARPSMDRNLEMNIGLDGKADGKAIGHREAQAEVQQPQLEHQHEREY